MKKILYVASTYGHILSFHTPYIRALQEMGYTVDISAAATNLQTKEKLLEELEGTHLVDMPFEKKMFSLGNLRCTKKLITLLTTGKYDLISVHTSLAAFFVRLAVMLAFPSTKSKLPVINTVHGYLFDEQTPFPKRILLLGAEKLMKSVTNHLVVMNKEDYQIAEKHHLYQEFLSLIPGMGIDTERFSINNFLNLDRAAERVKMGFQPTDTVLIYAAEFSKRKNQKMLVEAMHKLPVNVKLILAGQGEQLEACKAFASDLNLSSFTKSKSGVLGQSGNSNERVFFTGHVNNLDYYYFISDVCVSSSRSEGLPFNVMEAMAMGLPVIATRVKGHTDLIEDGKNGFLYSFDSVEAFVERALEFLNLSPMQLDQVYKFNEEKAQHYSLKNVLKKVLVVYR